MKNHKRFTELTIADLPETARLVVLVGPNGTGKSSVFDSFLLKAKAAVGNYRLSGDTEEYYDKVSQSRTTHEVASRVGIEFHGIGVGEVDWKSAFQVRSAYRNESDFRIAELRATRLEDAEPRIARIIDRDESVSKNYERMVWKRLQDLDRDAPEEVTIGEYRRESLVDLQKAMRGLFSDPRLHPETPWFGGISLCFQGLTLSAPGPERRSFASIREHSRAPGTKEMVPIWSRESRSHPALKPGCAEFRRGRRALADPY